MTQHHFRIFVASAVAVASIVLLAGGAQATEQRARHRHVAATHRGDIIVHTGRSYLDPGTSATVGSENHYFSDTVPYGPGGPTFSSAIGGQELLPTRFNPPGRYEPLFRF